MNEELKLKLMQVVQSDEESVEEMLEIFLKEFDSQEGLEQALGELPPKMKEAFYTQAGLAGRKKEMRMRRYMLKYAAVAGILITTVSFLVSLFIPSPYHVAGFIVIFLLQGLALVSNYCRSLRRYEEGES